MAEFLLNALVEIRRDAPKKYLRFARQAGTVIGTAGLTPNGTKYRVRFGQPAKSIVVLSKYLRPITPYEPGFVHAPPCQFPDRACTCGVM